MQDDKDLKELLAIGSTETTSPDFTGKVMRRIERIQFINAPLVSKKLVRLFRLIFLSIVSLSILISLLISVSPLSLNINFDVPEIYYRYGDTTFVFIIAFWALIFISQKITSNKFHLN